MPQIQVAYYDNDGNALGGEYVSSINDGIGVAYKELSKKLEKCKLQFPDTYESKIIRTAKIYDDSNQYKWLVTISNAGKMSLRRQFTIRKK
jgi:hypothetical protein